MLCRRLRHFKAKLLRWILTGVFCILTFLFVTSRQKEPVNQCKDLELVEEDARYYINCSGVLDGNEDILKLAKLQLISNIYQNRPVLSETDYIGLTKHCPNFTKFQKYVTFPISKEEEEFPIAYSIVIHHRIDMFGRLLRSIYAPQNFYCVHVDKKSSTTFFDAVKGIVSCFDNVFIASQLESVTYASFSRVQADVNCMKDLLQRNSTWKYLINLCGLDFPLKTNFEMVENLKALKGKNSLETEKTLPHKEKRWKQQHQVVNGRLKNMGTSKQPPPIATPMFSGSAYFVVSRDFVEYILGNTKIQNFLMWEKDTFSPDEHMWATLQRMPNVPGSVPVNTKFDVSDMNSLARLVKWSYLEGDVSKGAPYPPCTGTHIRSVCVYGAGDLNWMLKQHHLFANKFDSSVDGIAVQCLEEHLRRKALKRFLTYT
ncbi:beta-1,3-galactosyl-O-glycosyl-glycoprotein beta-1,6-N-acetylglucosaminyltransferase [Callorhinchus milii]|uniref:Glucosaminyl (N-acetyl) transferase 1 n=1 Tax=Callorhinchus milii TaxID=7868 RepID=A0A4W3IS25_CALMI|nr:beta-1,3-galactosyl-O-glycosyl-glycoprotein beta-1,6-N-acetylglucosaminyltransferase [Callorhinchus milii]|eukprot:gi/632973370/ref/XP_007903121.1/ PREDICTED: beta-1,3-galactosyl-O-glycosyl-glycoprotein beta-1,6-N-acetylglucosaminyltransferase [Callorhinchus milii]